MTSPTSQQAPESSGGVKQHSTLLLVVLLLTISVGAAILWYGLRVGSLMLLIHASELGLVAVAVWAAFDANHIRRLLHQLSQAEREDAADEPKKKLLRRYLRQATEAQSLHVIYIAVPTATIGFFVIFQTWRLGFAPNHEIPVSVQATLGLLAIATSIVWLLVSSTMAAIDETELPEVSELARGFRESQWSAWLIAAALFAGAALPKLSYWVGLGLSIWLIGLCAEQLARTMWVWISPPLARSENTDLRYVSPIHLLLREAFLVRGSPLGSFFDVLEAKFGVNFRASWALALVRRVTGPLFLLLIVLGWLLTALQVVEPHQFAVEERLGHTVTAPLEPGLHLAWPWPLSNVRRFPVKTVFSMQVGFKDSTQAGGATRGFDPETPRALLWTQAHEEEFSLVLGNGTEVVAVNAIVLFKIHEEQDRFFDYVYRSQNPETALEALAYRTLLELTRSATLNDVLTADRAGFANRFREKLRVSSEEQRLGIDVVDVALINLHPPVNAAADYLDVISAQLDATRMESEATGFRSAKLLTSEAEGFGLVATAKIDASRRVASATAESSEFLAAASAQQLAAESYSLRLWIEGLEQCLRDKRFFVVEKTLLEKSDQAWLDLRPISTTLPMEGPSSAR